MIAWRACFITIAQPLTLFIRLKIETADHDWSFRLLLLYIPYVTRMCHKIVKFVFFDIPNPDTPAASTTWINATVSMIPEGEPAILRGCFAQNSGSGSCGFEGLINQVRSHKTARWAYSSCRRLRPAYS